MVIEQTLGQLAGVLVGGGITGLVAWTARRGQVRATLEAEQRAREDAATSRLAETAAKLLVLDGPDGVLTDTHEEYMKELDARWAAWRRTRAELILFFKVAALDVTEIELRDDLDACVLLMQISGPGSASYNDTPDGEKDEAVIRHEACRFTIAAIGEYRRDELITPPSGWFGQRLDDARDRMLARRVEMRRQARDHPVLPRFYRYGAGPLRWWQRLRRRAMIREQRRAWQQHVSVFEYGASGADSGPSDASSTLG